MGIDSKWMTFEVIEPKPGCKTSLCVVRSKRTNETLGIIKWMCEWRAYVFYPIPDTVYSEGCLQDITEQIKQMPR